MPHGSGLQLRGKERISPHLRDLLIRQEADGSHGLGSRVDTRVFSRLGSLPTPSPSSPQSALARGAVKVADHGGEGRLRCAERSLQSYRPLGFTQERCARWGWMRGLGRARLCPGAQSLRLGRTYCSFFGPNPIPSATGLAGSLLFLDSASF